MPAQAQLNNHGAICVRESPSIASRLRSGAGVCLNAVIRAAVGRDQAEGGPREAYARGAVAAHATSRVIRASGGSVGRARQKTGGASA